MIINNISKKVLLLKLGLIKLEYKTIAEFNVNLKNIDLFWNFTKAQDIPFVNPKQDNQKPFVQLLLQWLIPFCFCEEVLNGWFPVRLFLHLYRTALWYDINCLGCISLLLYNAWDTFPKFSANFSSHSFVLINLSLLSISDDLMGVTNSCRNLKLIPTVRLSIDYLNLILLIATHYQTVS